MKIKNPNHKLNQPVPEFVENNFALDRKIKEACRGILPCYQWLLMELPRNEDKELIADFILEWSNDGDGAPMLPNTKIGYIQALVYLARHHGHKKSFKEMTSEDFFSKEIMDEKTGKKRGFLENIKRSFEDDPKQKWINTHNVRGGRCLAFWRWMTQPELKREERQTPPQLKGYRRAKRKDKAKTTIKREDHWTPEEHKAFLDYCEDPRLACFHAIARDTGARPGELLQLKISDIQIKVSPSTGRKYAEFWIGDKVGGKSKKARPASISNAIPYFNIWTAVHPMRDNPQGAYLFPSMENKAKYRNKPLQPVSLRQAYVKTIEVHFPKLLTKPNVPIEDKAVLRRLINDKPHFPYLIRHEFASEWAPILPPTAFNQLMGHSPMSRQREVYVQELGTEGNRELLIARGIINREETISPIELKLAPKYCPICHEANKQDADFCFKCNWIISKKGAEETKEKDAVAVKEAEETKRQLAELKLQQQLMRAEYEIDRANKRNEMDFILRKTDKLAFHVPCYRHDDPEQEKIKEIIVLGEYLRKKRESEEENSELMTFAPAISYGDDNKSNSNNNS